MSNWRRRTLVTLRILAIGFATLGSAYFFLLFRTQEFGFTWGGLAVSALFALPLVTLAWIGMQSRAAAAGVLGVVCFTALGSEVWAAWEESRFQQSVRAAAPREMVVQARAWPFGDHHLLYDPATARFHSGD